jgi:hypothetical protein
MEIGNHWNTIQTVFQRSRNSSLHFAVATVNEDGSPHLTPIGALFLRENKTGFYFDVFSVNMSKNLKHEQRVCILAVDSSLPYWAKSFTIGKCESPPSVRLKGTVGQRREATEAEISLWKKHVEFARGTKGYDLLWKDMRFVRDIYFDSFEPVYMGEMTRELWKD